MDKVNRELLSAVEKIVIKYSDMQPFSNVQM